MSEILRRIDQRIAEIGTTRRAASLKAGLGAEYIRDMGRKKTVSPSITVLEKLAAALETTVERLRTGHDDDDRPTERMAVGEGVPLVGVVGAGAAMLLFEHGQWDPAERVKAPEGATPDTVAVEIRGASLGELFDRWIVYYDQVRLPPTPELINKLCVVGLADGRVLVKKLRRGSAPGLWTLLSNSAEDPIKDVGIVWAAKVKQMSPR